VIFPDPNDGKAPDSIRSIAARWPENPPVVVTDPTGAVSEQLFYPLVPR
jgi:hypothetical protein